MTQPSRRKENTRSNQLANDLENYYWKQERFRRALFYAMYKPDVDNTLFVSGRIPTGNPDVTIRTLVDDKIFTLIKRKPTTIINPLLRERIKGLIEKDYGISPNPSTDFENKVELMFQQPETRFLNPLVEAFKNIGLKSLEKVELDLPGAFQYVERNINLSILIYLDGSKVLSAGMAGDLARNELDTDDSIKILASPHITSETVRYAERITRDVFLMDALSVLQLQTRIKTLDSSSLEHLSKHLRDAFEQTSGVWKIASGIEDALIDASP